MLRLERGLMAAVLKTTLSGSSCKIRLVYKGLWRVQVHDLLSGNYLLEKVSCHEGTPYQAAGKNSLKPHFFTYLFIRFKLFLAHMTADRMVVEGWSQVLANS